MLKKIARLFGNGSEDGVSGTTLQGTFSSVLQSKKVTLVLLGTTILLSIVCFVLASRPPVEVVKVETKTEYVDRVVERVIEKEVVKWKERLVTEVRPDGTTVKTEEREGSKVVDVAKLAERVVEVKEVIKYERATPKEVLRRYHVGGSVTLDTSLERVYVLDVGARIGNLPLFVVVSGGSDRRLGLGLRLEF